MVSCETAGADRIQPSVDAGLLIPFWLRDNPRSALVHAAKGNWPQPVDAQGTPVPLERAVKLRWLPSTPAMWEEVGGYAFEGTASFAEMILRDLISSGRKVQEEVVGTYEEEGIKLGAAARSHFGVAQQDVLRLLAEAPRGLFDASKGKVQYVLFTGHESAGQDEGMPIYGVGIIGKAAVKSVPKLVGTLLHHEVDKKSGQVWAYYKPHADLQNASMVWDAKANLPAHPAVWAAAEKRWPGGRMELRFDQTLFDYLKFQEDAKQGVAKQLAQQARVSDAVVVEAEKAVS